MTGQTHVATDERFERPRHLHSSANVSSTASTLLTPTHVQHDGQVHRHDSHDSLSPSQHRTSIQRQHDSSPLAVSIKRQLYGNRNICRLKTTSAVFLAIALHGNSPYVSPNLRRITRASARLPTQRATHTPTARRITLSTQRQRFT